MGAIVSKSNNHKRKIIINFDKTSNIEYKTQAPGIRGPPKDTIWKNNINNKQSLFKCQK